jgi:DNA polymerase-3 subunit epsilon
MSPVSLLNRLRAWHKGHEAAATGRWVVLDVESSGLNPRQDRLLAIAAIALRVDGRRAVIELGDSFEVVLHQTPRSAEPDRANILLHGIGVGAQSAGMGRPKALQAFQAYVAGAPLIAFHAAFDRAMIDRAFQAEALQPPANPWLDLEPLAAVLQPQVKARSLDEWMLALDIRCAARHQAAADTLATAELLLKLWPRLLNELPRPEFSAVQALAAHRRWMPA